MRRLLLLAALLVAGCATYAEPYPDAGYPAYPAYSYGYVTYAYPGYTHRPVRDRAWRRHGHWRGHRWHRRPAHDDD